MNTPYVIFGSLIAHEGKAAELLEILHSGHDMGSFPGCQEYRIFTDADQPQAIWILETWDSKDAHQKSLQDPLIKSQIQKAMPLIKDFGQGVTLLPQQKTATH